MYAGLLKLSRCRTVMIRRELPRTERADWSCGSYRIESDEDSPFRGIHAAFGAAVWGKYTFLFQLALAFWIGSAWAPMAQINPSSSRAIAVTIWFLFLPLAANVL